MIKNISISPGNRKMGQIPSISLPPITACPSGVPCAKKCYAARMCRTRKTVREAYERNLEIYNESPAAYFAAVKAAAAVTRYFRWHVSGDILGAEYLQGMIETAEALPGTQFLAFTKNYKVINEYAGSFPENLHLILSTWGSWAPDNPHNLPTAAVIFKHGKPQPGWKVCGGNCTECACQGVGCWELKPGETIAFYEH